MALTFQEVLELGNDRDVSVVGDGNNKTKKLSFLFPIDANGKYPTGSAEISGYTASSGPMSVDSAVIAVFADNNDNPTKPLYYVEGPGVTDKARDVAKASGAKPVTIEPAPAGGRRNRRKSRITRKKRKSTRRTRKH